MARWKARGRLYIRRNWTFFAICYGWDVMSRNPSKSAFFEEGWVTFNQYLTGKRASPTNHCCCQKTRVIAVSCGIKIFAVHCLVLSQYTHLADRRTELRQQYRALHYMQSHGKNWWVMGQHLVTHDPCDPSDFRDPFDPWPMTHPPIPCSGVLYRKQSWHVVYKRGYQNSEDVQSKLIVTLRSWRLIEQNAEFF